MASGPAFALSLGRISVQSALGEPLRAEIEVPNITAEEAASLKANAASPADFAAAGLEYNPAMAGLQATLARRSDGRSFIRLSSERTISEPFVDLILEASWSSGRIVRDYTMLFDPPSLKQSAVAPTLPQTSTAAPASTPAKVAPARQAPEAASPANKPAAAPKAAAAEGGQRVTVQPGDSASKLALGNKAADVSLDQMLVALLRANPDAFNKGNLNRLRAGAVVDLPSAEQARAIPAAEATQTVIAQSKDFNEFRRNLAANAPQAAVEGSNRKASGSVQAKVDDKKPSTANSDKLTLSKGALQAKANEEKLAKERADKEAAARAAELAKNIEDLKKLSVATASSAPKAAAAPTPAPAPAALPAASAPALPKMDVTAAPPVVVAPAPLVSAPVAPPPAPAPMASTPTLAAPATAEPAQETSLIDDLMEDPTLPLAGAGLLLALGGYAFYRRQQSKKLAAQVDSSFLESRLQPDSFFGASGGQKVDTAQSGASANSSVAYNSSQMGAADDVDPVAEADVYLAYGRDVQAEEILKEAVRHNPQRLAIHSKLLDVYAKRRDLVNFQASANAAFEITGADSPEWARICELGLSIDPSNPLYQPGGASASKFASLEQHSDAAALSPNGDSTIPVSSLGELPGGGTDLDLDLDFSAEEEARASGIAPLTASADSTQAVAAQADPQIPPTLDFDISAPGDLDMMPSPQEQDNMLGTSRGAEPSALTLDLDALDLGEDSPEPSMASLPEEAAAEEAPAQASAPADPDGMLQFDLGSLSLDLGPESKPAPVAMEEDENSSFGESSLSTKLALAEEFVSIGDQDGARALIEEVVAEATGELREKAQRALAALA